MLIFSVTDEAPCPHAPDYLPVLLPQPERPVKYVRSHCLRRATAGPESKYTCLLVAMATCFLFLWLIIYC